MIGSKLQRAANDQFNNRRPSKTDMSDYSNYSSKPVLSALQSSGIPKKLGVDDLPKKAGSYTRTPSDNVSTDQVGRRAWKFTQNIFHRLGSHSTAAREPGMRKIEQERVGGAYGPEYSLYQRPEPLDVNRNEWRQVAPEMPPAVYPVRTPVIGRQPLQAPVIAHGPALVRT